MLPQYRKTWSIFRSLAECKDLRGYLTGLKEHELGTFYHSLQVGILSIDLGIENCVNKGLLYSLGYAGMLHDLGKEDIPLEILIKDGPLTAEERAVIETHPRLGFLFAENNSLETTKKVVVAHHEYKRKPYPREGIDRRTAPRGTEERRIYNPRIVQLAQMVAAADLYDALTSARSYKKPWPIARVENVLRQEYLGDQRYIDQLLRWHRQEKSL
ncbi:MAG TPA: HD domain-containing phosphohydrolase [Candidatus Nanoarchaeia archaeon]|nr:HD domain-containing phosphohydrolase [Candidatus Nanoarchaeia archaeon]